MKNNTRERACFHGRWIIHGYRRRRCVFCGKTRTMRVRRRGRKRKRVSIKPLVRYLNGKGTRTSQRDLQRARDLFLRTTPWPPVARLPRPCILIVDALHLRTRTYRMVVHIILVASTCDDRAWILPVFFHPHSESEASWAAAFEYAITPALRRRVKGLVCDGKQGLLHYAQQQGWKIQRCQFHLIARLQSLRSVRALSRHRQQGVTLSRRVHALFETPSTRVSTSIARTLAYCAHTEPNRHLRTVLSGLAKNYLDYRTCHRFPELCLPHTTNAVESVNSLIRALMRRMRGFENEQSARAWIEALLKHRRFMRLSNHRKSV